MIPGLLGARVLLDPRERGGEQGLVVGDELVDEAGLEGLGRAELLALQDRLGRGLDPDQSGQALGPAGAGHDPELDLWQAELCARVVDGDASVTRERELVAAAEGRAVEGRDDGDAGGLDRAVELVERGDLCEHLGGVAGGVDLIEVGAGAEVLVRRGDDDALEALAALGPGQRVAQALAVGLIDDVDPARHREGQDGDALGLVEGAAQRVVAVFVAHVEVSESWVRRAR